MVWGVVFFADIASHGPLQAKDGHLLNDVAGRFAAAGRPPQSEVPWLAEIREPGGVPVPTPSNGCRAAGASDETRLFAGLPSAPDWSFYSLANDCGRIDVLMPEVFEIDPHSRTLRRKSVDIEAQDAVDRFIADPNRQVEVYPSITIGEHVSGLGASSLFADPISRKQMVDAIGRAASASVRGFCLNAGGWPDTDAALLGSLMAELRQTLSATGHQTCLIVNANQALWKKRQIHGNVDRMVLQLYEAPWIGSPPAPLAEDAWFMETAREALALLGPEKLVAAVGTMSVDWKSGHAMPETIAYSEAVTRIANAGAQIRFLKKSGNAFASFVDGNGLRHEIWMLDAVTAYNQLSVLDELGARNVAVMPLGYEDPALWKILDRANGEPAEISHALRSVDIENYVHYVGDGPFLRTEAAPVQGLRTVRFAEDGRGIVGQTYQRTPSAATVRRYGRAAPNQIVLTFDDGPHPVYTAAILDALRDHDVPATFFVVGNNAMRAPELVHRMVEEGHEIGSHTFMHPRMDQISYYRSVVEVNSVQKLISGMTGRAMRLYREPFMRSEGPLTAAQTEPLRLLHTAGYVVAGSDIVPLDWKDTPADDIVAHVVENVESGAGNIIVLHDAGDDRTQTVQAVPALIEALRERGYEFVTMAEMLGTTRDALMPPVTGYQPMFDNVSFSSIALFWETLIVLFWVAIAIGVTRSLGVLVLALLRRRHFAVPATHVKPTVTVVIPAFNEEVVIVKSVQTVLQSRYPDLKVLVVDDGSYDDTARRVRAAFGDDPRVRLLTQRNQGKWRALNHAYAHIDTEIAVCLDADTQMAPDAIGRMVRHFSDPGVGAVAGKLIVGNRKNLLTRLQALEYITAQSIDRRAGDLINGMLVVPGAIGAWRVEAVRKAGFYSGATLSEDADLTIAVNRAGYRAVYDETAIALTEAPATLKGFLAQRLRWALGMFQSGWKHRGALREGRTVGMVALPDLAIFGYLFPLLAPFADLLFLYMLWDYVDAAFSTDLRVSAEPPAHFFLGYLALPLMEVVIAFVAICIDRTEKFRLLLLFPFQRFFYRQVLYFTVFRALVRALSGRLAKWNKGERAGFVATSGVK